MYMDVRQRELAKRTVLSEGEVTPTVSLAVIVRKGSWV
jgi:hypothetical protein